MIRVKVISSFTLARFDELKNIVRKSNQNQNGWLYVNDEFECTEEMYKYLTETNIYNQKFVEIIEIIPEENKKNSDKKEKTEKTSAKKNKVVKKVEKK